MERRRFLQLAALAGVAVVAPVGHERTSRAQEKDYTGPLWLFVHAGGGWDPTYVCDPKGGDINRLYAPGDIRSVGNLRYSPATYSDNGVANTSIQDFFERYGSRTCVINGLDTTTNNHDTGTRFVWSGKLEEGFPSFSALVASAYAPTKPLAFVSNGGFDVTEGVVPLTRLNGFDTFARIAYPNSQYGNVAKPEEVFQSNDTYERINTYQQARLAAMRDGQGLPALQSSMSSLFIARVEKRQMEKVVSLLPSKEQQAQIKTELGKQSLLAFAAYKAGVGVSSNLSVGGFDTHGDHDNNQLRALTNLFSGLNEIVAMVDADPLLQGRVMLVVGSDFGRTPAYNKGNGKDHWPVTSMLLMGPGIAGNRVIGSSDGGFKAVGVNPQTLAPDPNNGTRIQPKHVHLSLRRLAGISDSPVAQKFPVAAEEIRLFG